MDDDTPQGYRARQMTNGKRVTVGVAVRPELRAALARLAAARGMTLSAYAAEALGEHAGVPA